VSTRTRAYRKILRNRKRRIERRLDPDRVSCEQAAPMLSASNVHDGCVPWTNRAIGLVCARAEEITLRGDTDFSLTAADSDSLLD
jgi:hypothetical protein